MSRPQTGPSQDELVYIDLDEPSPWWSSLIGVVVIMLIAIVLVSPWLIDLDSAEPDMVATNTMENSRSICRPDTGGLPNILDPSVASWSRFCEWFIAPESTSPGNP